LPQPAVLGRRYPVLLTLKNLFGLALGQTTGFVQSLLTLLGLALTTQHAMSQATPSGCASGISSQFGWTELASRLHGHQIPWRRRVEVQKAWRGASAFMAQTAHTGIDAQTLQVRVVCVNFNNVSYAAIAA